MTDFDRAVREFEERRAQGTQAAFISLLDGEDPEKVARARKVAQELGVPSRMVEQDYPAFERRLHHEADTKAIQENPWMASFFTADPERARVRGPGDVKKMVDVGNSLQAWADHNSRAPISVRRSLGASSALTPVGIERRDRPFREVVEDARSTPEHEPINWSAERGVRRVGGLLYAGAAGASQAVTATALAAAEQGEQLRMALGLGESRTAGFLRGYLAEQKSISEALRPDLGEGIYAELMQGIESVPLSLAAGYTAMRGNPGAGLAMMGAAAGGQAYGEAREQGVSPNSALLYSAGQGFSEAAWEASPLKFLDSVPLGSTMAKKLLGFTVREVGTEVGNSITQGFNIWGSIESNKGKSFGEFVKELPDDMRAAALGALAVGGAIGGLQKSGEIAFRRTQTDVDRVSLATRGGQWLDDLMKGSEDIEMRKLDPETFQSFIAERTENSPVRHVYVPVEAVERVLAQEGVDQETVAFLEGHRAQIEEAQRTRGDIVVALADAVANLSGTPAWEALKDDVRVTPAGLSPREAREQGETILKQLEQRGEEIAGEALDEAEAQRPVVATYQRAKNEMLSIGVPSARAEAYARLFAAQREVAAGRMRMSIEEYEKLRPVSFASKATKKRGRKVAQAHPDSINIGLDIPDGGTLAPEDAIAALKARGVDISSSEVRQSATEQTLVATLSRGLSAKEVHALSEELGQEAIAAWSKGKGILAGPEAAKWGDFNEDFYLRPRTLQQGVAAAAFQEDVLPQAGWSEERIGGLIDKYDRGDGTSTAYAAMMTPDEYHGLTLSAKGRQVVAERVAKLPEYGELDALKLDPIGLMVQLGGQPSQVQLNMGVTSLPNLTAGHEGRHRMMMLKNAGIARVPIIINVRDGVATERDSLTLSPQRSRADQLASGDAKATLTDLVPITWANRDRLVDMAKGSRVLFQGEAFERWFGDSKVVDANGAPLVVYHGTDAEFEVFDPKAPNKNSGGTAKGFYFTPIKSEAAGFGAKIVSGYLSIKHPYVAGEADISDAMADAYRAELVKQNPHLGDSDTWFDRKVKALRERQSVSSEALNGNRAAIQRVLRAGGFDGVRDGRHWVVFTPSQIKSTANRGTWDPADDRIMYQGPRGEATFLSSGEKIITLFGTADASTMIHEMGHVFLEEMFEDARLPQAPEELKADVEKIKAWMAANGHPVGDAGGIPTEAHELWARAFERHAREGKAPSPELRSAFASFRSWLTAIYKSVAQLKAPITPEIRDIMNRMLATEEAIAANQIAPMSQEALGMTAAEYVAYLESVQGARDQAHDTLLEKMMATIRRREQKRIREQRDVVRGEIAAEVNSRPEFVALHLLRTGAWLGDPERPRQDVKLHTGWLIDNYGADVLKQLPRGLPITRGDGLDGDTIAEMVGMPSGDALVQSLLEGRRVQAALKEAGEKRSARDKIIDDQVEQEMTERHGDIAMSEEAIQEEAIAALNSERQGEVIATEIRQLRKRTDEGGASTPYQIAREWARRKINAGRVGEIATRGAVQRYIRATNKAQRAAEEAVLSGDTNEAFRQKQAQMLNHALLAESKAAADDVDTIVKRMNRLAKRATMGSVDQDYLDRIHELLERFDFRQRSQRAVEEQESFNDWARGQIDKGLEVHIPARLMDVGEHYSRVTLTDLLALDDAVKSLLHLGRLKQRILDAQAERDFNDFRDDIVARIARLPDRTLPDTPIDDEKRLGAQAAAALLKVETIADELDGDANGPMNRLLVQRATEAATKRDELTEQVVVPLARLYASLSKAQRNRLDTKVTIPELTWNTVREGDPRQGQTVTMTRMQLLVVALNSGNVSNLEKMSRGERWPAPVIQAILQRELNKDDWDFVQAIWRGLDGMWPEIVRVEKELSGVAPERVVPMEVDTPFGPYQGGYWPVVYDSARSQQAENNTDDEVNDLFGFRAGIGTPKGHTITRTNARGPIRFSLEEVLLHHTEKVVTRIAYAPWVRDVIRVIENPKIRGMFDTKLGAEYRRQIKPWLRRQIAANAIDRRGSAWWEKTLRTFRTNMSVTTMGFAFSTGIAQTLGLGFSVGRLGSMGQKQGHLVGARYMAQGLRRMLSPVSSISIGAGALAGGLLMGPTGIGPGVVLAAVAAGKLNGFQAAETFVFSRSAEMARRGQEMNREVVEVFQRLRGNKVGWFSNAQAMAFWHIGMIDRYMVSMPTWLGAHQKGLDEGMSDEDASRFADKAVRLSQGSGREKDLAAVQSPNSEAFRFLTMFYTPFNVQFNAQWESVRAGKAGDWRKALVISTTFLMMTALADALVSGDWPEDDDEDGLGGLDLAEWFSRNVFFSLFAGVPIVRDAANTGERLLTGRYASGFAQTPVSSAMDAGWKAGEGSYKIAFEDEEVTGRYLKSMGAASGYAFGVPGGQLGKTGGFLWDYSQGEVEADTVRDWYSGLAYGKVPEDKE